MTEAQQIFRNTAVLSGAQIVERLSGLILALFISRELGAAGLGIYVTATAYFALIAAAAQGGSTNLLVREIAKRPAQTSRYLVHAGAMATALSAALMGLAWLVVPHLGQSADLEAGLKVIILAIVPGTLRTIQEAVFVAHQRVEFQTFVTFVGSALTVGASVYLLGRGSGVVSLLVAFVAVQYAIALAYVILINRYIAPIRLEFQRRFALRLLREMRAFAGMSLMAGIFARAEIVLLSLIASEAQVGLYSAALKLVDLWSLIPQTLMINVFPVLSRSFHRRDGRAQEIQNLAIKYLLAVALPLSVGLAAAAEPIITAFYGPGFEDAVLLLKLLAVNVTIICIWAVLWRVLAARGEQGAVLRAQIVTIAIRVGGGYAFITWLAAVGAAIITAVSLALYAGLLALRVRRDGTSVRIVALTWRFGLAAAGMGLVAVIVSGTVPIWVLVPAAAFTYAALLIALRAFSASDLARFRSLLPSPSTRLGGAG